MLNQNNLLLLASFLKLLLFMWLFFVCLSGFLVQAGTMRRFLRPGHDPVRERLKRELFQFNKVQCYSGTSRDMLYKANLSEATAQYKGKEKLLEYRWKS